MKIAGQVFFLGALLVLGAVQSAKAKVYGATDIMDPVMNNMCALTFDDGPHPRTHKVLDALKEENVRATFFVLGENVQYLPYVITRIHNEGHEIANHAFSHTALTSLSPEDVHKEISSTNGLLRDLGVPKPRFLRPPLGAYDKKVARIARKLEMDVVLWSTDSYDWQGRPDYANMPNMLREVMTTETQRGIYLFHDTKLVTAQDAKEIVQTLRAIGCKYFVTVSEYFDALASPEVMTALRLAQDRAQDQDALKPKDTQPSDAPLSNHPEALKNQHKNVSAPAN